MLDIILKGIEAIKLGLEPTEDNRYLRLKTDEITQSNVLIEKPLTANLTTVEQKVYKIKSIEKEALPILMMNLSGESIAAEQRRQRYAKVHNACHLPFANH